jgi:hypothetical protein
MPYKCKKNKLLHIIIEANYFDAVKTDKQQNSDKTPIKTKPTYIKVSKAKLALITVCTKQISKPNMEQQ